VKQATPIRGTNTALFPLIGLIFAAILVVFAGREFPSQDGPIHLYYAEVTRNLLLSTGLYQDTFTIVHYLSPYILQTYLLGAFDCVFDPLVSEKLLVCCYAISFVLGFRYLVRSLLPASEVSALFIAPLIFNYFVYAGNYNYVLGLSIVLWAAGFWIRYSSALTRSRHFQCAAFIVLLALTHPLALLTFLLFAGLHLVLTAAAGMSHSSLYETISKYRGALIFLTVSSISLLWVARFMTADNRSSAAGTLRSRLIEALMMWAISPVKTRPFRYFLAGAVSLATIVAIWGWLRTRNGLRLAPAAMLFVEASVFCFIGLFSPARVSGGTNLGSRFFLFGVLLLLASGAVAPVSQKLRRALAGVFCIGASLCFIKLYRLELRVNAELLPLLEAPPAAAHLRIAWVTGVNSDPDFTHDPRYWAVCHYIRRSRAVFANYGFLYLPYMNLGVRKTGRCQFLDPIALPDRPSMQSCLLQAAGQPDRPPIDVLVSASFDALSLASTYGLQHEPYSAGGIDFYGHPPVRAYFGRLLCLQKISDGRLEVNKRSTPVFILRILSPAKC